MPQPGFYNDNEYRAYPLVAKPSYAGHALPDSAIVDAGVIMGLASEFDAAAHSVWLAWISRTGGIVTFSFATNAPAATSTPLQFQFNETTNTWTHCFAESDPYGGALPSGSGCADEPLWEGFMVAGPLEALCALVGDGETVTFPAGERALEPGRIQSLVKGYVRSFNVANFSRVMALPPLTCREASPTDDVRTIVINKRCMKGDIRFQEGYNARIQQVSRSNELRFAAEKGAGDTNYTELCAHGSELPLQEDGDDEADPETGFYSGGPACDQVISTLNGVSGNNVTLVGGTGISITTDAEAHTITVALATNNLVGNCN